MTSQTGSVDERFPITTKYRRRLIYTIGILVLVNQLINLTTYSSSFESRERQVLRTLGGDICASDTASVAAREKLKKVSQERALSINLGNGECEYTDAEQLSEDDHEYGIVFASYPAAGMRLAWQHVEGLTGIKMADDFDCESHIPKSGFVKTQYPHLEGIWSWGDRFDEVIMVLRNPRWAIPSYHTLLHEIDYAHDCETAYEMLFALFTYRPPVWKWIRWRDYRFEEEIKLWCFHIDYWMGNGTQYWMGWDFERNGQHPFAWIPEEERFQDNNCIYQKMDCIPKTVVAYEYVKDPVKGPDEVNKIAQRIEGKPGLVVIEKEARECVWHQTMENKEAPSNDNREGDASDYRFTLHQMGRMREEIEKMKVKYSSDPWTSIQTAQDLVEYFDLYITEISEEMIEISGKDWPPTPAPNPEYHQGLVEWYKNIGRGDRYNKGRVQDMVGLWPSIAHLYDDDEA